VPVTSGASVKESAGVVLVAEVEVVVVVELEVVVEEELVDVVDVVVDVVVDDEDVGVGLTNGTPGVSGPGPKMSGTGRGGNCLPSNCTTLRYWAPIKVAGEGE